MNSNKSYWQIELIVAMWSSRCVKTVMRSLAVMIPLLCMIIIAFASPMRPTALTLLITEDTNGYLQACGCTGKQVGGLAKRATLMQTIRSNAEGRGNTVVLVDGGNIARDSSQSDAVLQSMQIMGYQAICVGDLESGRAEAFRKKSVSCGMKVLPSPQEQQDSKPPNAEDEILRVSLRSNSVIIVATGTGSTTSVSQRLDKTLSCLADEHKYVVVISQLNGNQDLAILASDKLRRSINLYIGLRNVDGAKSIWIGNTLLLPAARKGQVAIADICPTSHDSLNALSATYKLQNVTENLTEDPRVASVVADYYINQQALLATVSNEDADWIKVKYASAATCGDCHPKQMAVWEKMKHAQGVRTLLRLNRLVPECLTCHSELFRSTNTFDPSNSLAMNGVECASCHGDGIDHSALRSKGSISRSQGELACRRCHDAQNDPNFNYKTYLTVIRHW